MGGLTTVWGNQLLWEFLSQKQRHKAAHLRTAWLFTCCVLTHKHTQYEKQTDTWMDGTYRPTKQMYRQTDRRKQQDSRPNNRAAVVMTAVEGNVPLGLMSPMNRHRPIRAGTKQGGDVRNPHTPICNNNFTHKSLFFTNLILLLPACITDEWQFMISSTTWTEKWTQQCTQTLRFEVSGWVIMTCVPFLST